MTDANLPDDRSARQRGAWTLFGIAVHRKIRTGQRQVPWSAVFILAMMWFTWGFNLFAGGQALTFTIQKYSKDPRIISIVMTVTGLIMISPLISYVSDQIWTRTGRRRPFLIVAWIGGFLAMASFAFLPQVSAGINHVLGMVGIPPVAELTLLAVIIGCYKKMFDGAATIEPLFLECVPSHQRGRFFAIRGQLFTLAVLLFYQALWPRFDVWVDMFAWAGRPGILLMTGEQTIYILAAFLFLMTGFFLIFCVDEVKMESAPNMSFREVFLGSRHKKRTATSEATPVDAHTESSPGDVPPYRGASPERSTGVMDQLKQIPIVAFVASFLKDVFLKVSNYPFYIMLVIPGMEGAVWGNFNALMQNDQFRYSKDNQSLWALPIGLISMWALTPFAGWYSDVRVNVKWWMRILLLIISAASFTGMYIMYKTYEPADIRELPHLWVLFAVSILTAIGVLALYVPMVETMLDYVGREHARAWVSLLTVFKSMANVGLLYLYIRLSPDHTPPIMVWMMFAVVGGAMGTLMDTFVAPMIWDYMPRSQMGTINSGTGIYSSFVTFAVANLGAWWVFYYSAHFVTQASLDSNEMKYDYTSMYILQFLLFVPAIIAKIYFIRLILKGKMQKWGTMEVEEGQSAKEAAAQHETAVVSAE